MKKFILSFFLFTITTTAFTQIKKGQFLLGGNIHFESTKEQYSTIPANTTTNFFISPAIGYFIFDKIAGGLRLDLGFMDTKSDNPKTHYTTTGISPFVRYYFLPVAKKINVFVDVSYVHNRTKWIYFNNPAYYQKAKGYSISAGPAIFLTGQVALEFTLGYKHTRSNNLDNTKSSIINSGLGLQIHFGKNRS